MDESTLAQLKRISQSVNLVAAQGREVVTVGPFQALLDPSTDMIWLNYAVPIAPLGSAREVAEALTELRRVFADRHRTIRFEFIEALWPALPGALEEAGLQLQGRQPLMLCTPADFQPFNAPDVRVQRLTNTDKDILTEYLSIQSESFNSGEANEFPSTEMVEQLREHLQRGSWRCAMATLEGMPAGGGCITPLEGLCELVGVGTLPSMRRRGVAATLCSFLVQDHFDCGGDLVWLSAGDAVSQALYQKIGFSVVNTQLNYIDAEKNLAT
ncbi:GNAT family N-acetyltransferase [Microcoleus sp. FACHB-672]|uniref:GNAT family N-acetyltransferase n=1 Tax=Microcoleus sp. FACHB-672 TaxID=2692825 RepID=UPI001688F743|nr:GNAT family N-acetyltransferase [Microcoleus sp. FACHB-672]MBD2041625.1 GNAT family N-acetyltransferase [Microcoleus sp. FACHB-672]